MARREGYLLSKGVRLFHWSITPDDYSAHLLFVHGMAEHSGRYQEVAEHFASLGYCCHALDLRGLGRSEGPRGHADSFQDLIDDTALLADTIRSGAAARDAARPLFLVGHSMGGLIVLAAGLKYPAVCNGVIASSPALEVKMPLPGWKKALAALSAKLMPRLSVDNGIRGKIALRDPEEIKSYDEDPLLYTKVSAGFYASFSQVMSETLANAGKFSLPLLILQAGDDQILNPGAARQFALDAGIDDKKFILYDGLYHALFSEPEKAQVFDDMAAWLKAHTHI
ncbi:MAG TPA: hypothetical protein DHD79_04705 [Firmicutes bacterium]|jgi:lysophospholipase|nr:hypothetical protein [Bacillota bacterium]